MTATVAQLRAAVKAKMLTVEGMGTVHDYQRYAKDQSALAALYASTAQGGKRLYGWYLSRVRTPELLVSVGRNYRDVVWRIRGFMALDDADATETLFDDQIEAICDAFRDDPDLGGLCDTTFQEANGNQAGIQVDEQAPVLFAGVLCHAAALGLITRVYTNT